ncbi:MAG: acyl-CoA dehydrogenase family protein [Nitrososphaerota archaeon]|nr:acyl-CoA dehydrogenase family protein [Nitrososphaerota archaeon]
MLQTTEQLSKKIAENATETDSKGLFPSDNIHLLGRQGFLSAILPRPVGLQVSHLLFARIVETLARACASTAWVYTVHSAASYSLFSAGNEAQRERYVRGAADGTKLFGFAATETGTGAGMTGLQTSVTPAGDAYLLNGVKSFISLTQEADIFLVLAKPFDSQQGSNNLVCVVEKGTPGFEVGESFEGMGMRGISWGELLFKDCVVPKSNIIGDAFRAISSGGHVGMLGSCAISLGLAQAGLDLALKHAKERTILGQKLASREGIQFLLSEMASDVQAMRQMLYFGAEENERSPNAYPSLLQMKIFITETAVKVLDKALRVTGATGYSRGVPLERYYRDVRAPMLHFQTLETAKRALGSML